MNPTPVLPDCASVARYGNLLLQLWSPPENGDVAAQAFGQLLDRLAASASQGFLIGYRPGQVQPALAEQPDAMLADLLRQVTTPAAPGAFHGLSPNAIRQHLPTLAAGSLFIRRRSNQAGDLPARAITHVGRPALIVALDVIAQAYAESAGTPALHRLVSVQVDPLTGYRQDVGRRIRELADHLNSECLATWNPGHLCLMAGPEALSSLHGRLAESLARA